MMLVFSLLLPEFVYDIPSAYAQQAAQSWKILFQHADQPVPAGVLADAGETYSLKKDGAEYGWNRDLTEKTVSRATYTGTTENYIQVSDSDMWEIKLENGIYMVAATVSRSVYSPQTPIVLGELPMTENLQLGANGERVFEQEANVQNGRLILEVSQGAAVALKSLLIVPVEESEAPLAARPVISDPLEARKVKGNKILLSGQSTNAYATPEYIRVPGLDHAIQSEMELQLKAVQDRINGYAVRAIAIPTSDSVELSARIAQIAANSGITPVVQAGHLNLEQSATIGSPAHPVIVMVDGLNTNRKLSLTVYGSLIVKSGLNANTELDIRVEQSSLPDGDGGNLWVMGSLHLNQNSSVTIGRQLVAGELVYNSGTLQIKAKHVLVKGNLNINTRVDMSIAEEIIVGELVSNNETANLIVEKGDFFVKGNIAVNNHLSIRAGGWVAMGGNLVANKQPIIQTGGSEGQTRLKYTLNGLKAEYYSESGFSGNQLNRVDEQVLVGARPILPAPGFNDQDFSVRWSGQLVPRYSDRYQLELQARGEAKLWVDGQLLAETVRSTEIETITAMFQARAGRRVDIQIEYSSKDGNPQAALYWASLRQQRELVPQTHLYPLALPTLAVTATETSLFLEWGAVAGAEGYELEVDGAIYPIGVETKYRFPGLKPGSAHTYRIRANAGDIIGEWTPVGTHWTLPDVPANIRSEAGYESISLFWDAVEGATGYEVETNNTIMNMGESLSYLNDGLGSNMQRTYRVRAYNSSGTGKWSVLLVDVTLPGAPANLKGTATHEAVTITWEPVSGATSYELLVDDASVGQIYANKYIHAPVKPASSHIYQVRASNGQGISPWSQPITIHAQPEIPVQVLAEASETTILFTWSDTPGAIFYEIELDGSVIPVGAATRYEHSGLVQSTEHTYRVRALSQQVSGNWTPLKQVITSPAVPRNVQSITVDSSTIELTWEPVQGAGGYELDVDGRIVSHDSNTLFRHKGLMPNSVHTYRVRAWNTGGAGLWSALVSKATGLGQPQNMNVLSSNDSITLIWDPVEGATSYEVLADGEMLDAGTEPRYVHNGLEPFSRHLYRVRAVSGKVFGDWSDTISTLTALGTPRIIDIQSGSSQIDIQWTEVMGASSYEVEADGVVIAVGAASSYSHMNLPSNTAHSYRVRAINNEITGEWSNWSKLATESTSPPVPANFKAAALPSSIKITWDRVMGASGYELEVDGQVVPIGVETSYIHGGLDPNTMHAYRLRSQGSGGASEWTTLLKQATIPEITVDIAQDTQFNFVTVIPRKAGKTERRITVTYNPEELEVLDLSSITPEYERGTGPVKGTNIVVTGFTPGSITYTIYDVDKTVVNSIRFLTKSNEYSKITYVID